MTDSTSRTVITLAGLTVLAWCVWLVRDVLPPFILAFVLALLLEPARQRMERAGMRRWQAVTLISLGFLALLAAILAFVIPRAVGQVADLLQNFETYRDRSEAAMAEWTRSHAQLLQQLHLPPTTGELAARYRVELTGYLQALLRRVFGAVQASAGMLGWLVVIPIVTLYLLADMDRLRARVFHVLPETHRATVATLSHKVGGVFSAYVRGLAVVCASYGIVVDTVLALGFRLPYALILGLLAPLLYAIPYLGQAALIVVAAGIAWATGHGTAYIVGVTVTLVAIGQLFDQLITPRVIGRQVGLHPVVGLFALMVGGQLFGIAGMVVAIPVAASIRVVLIQLYPPLGEPLP